MQNHTSHLQSQVPSLFRAELERLLPSIVESFDVEAVLRTCIEQAASSYISGSSNLHIPEPAQSIQGVTETVVSSGPVAKVPVVQHQESRALPEPSFSDTFQPPPPQHDSRIIDPAFEQTVQEGRVRLAAEVFSDSGFASGNSCGCCGICSCDYGKRRQLTTGIEGLRFNQPSSQNNVEMYGTVDNSSYSQASTAGVALGKIHSDTSINGRSNLGVCIGTGPSQDRAEEQPQEATLGNRDCYGTDLIESSFDWDAFFQSR